MAKANAGRVLIMPRGEYDANATYECLDLVSHNNASWLAKKTATGIAPSEGEFWHKMADGIMVANNLDTESAGYALDARQGNVLKDLIEAIGAEEIRERIETIENKCVTYEDNIESLMNAVEEDTSTVRYVSDEADDNFDWIQVKDAEGEWINAIQAYTQNYPLYMTSANEGGFTAYKGSDWSGGIYTYLPNVTFGTSMAFNINQANGGGSVITGLIDLSRFTKIKLHHISSITDDVIANRKYNYVSLFVTNNKKEFMGDSVVASIKLVGGEGATTKNAEGDVELDISALNGEYFIGICCHVSNGTASTEISNMYME